MKWIIPLYNRTDWKIHNVLNVNINKSDNIWNRRDSNNVLKMKKYIYFIIAVVLVFVNVCFNVEAAGGALSNLRWSYRLDTPNVRTFYMVTLRQCHRECYVRTQCKAISYHRIQRACVLTSLDDSTAAEIKTPGWVNSAKRTWTNVRVDFFSSCNMNISSCSI